MKTFSAYGLDDCYFVWDNYRDNGNNALLINSKSEGPVCTVTINPGFAVHEDCIAVKNYSENAGIEDILREQGIIGNTPVMKFQINDFGTIVPVYKIIKRE